ncbi:MAG TPA: glycoside hydrolase family 76 protein, partial [Bacillota bacterium]|nr:glycoside hydrolase family 76 protein [Bacillota bacterium]
MPDPSPGPDAVKYYDDNAWVGLDLVSSWRLTGDATYLRRAQAVMRYAESGGDDAGGGLWWSEARTYRNTAANAATAELAAQLYLAMHDRTDLAWAERIYGWERERLVLPDGRVEDGVAGGSTQPRDTHWTYNYGSVVAAGVARYQATGRTGYLTDAESVATYALHHLRRPDGALPPRASFDGVLADGLLKLWRVDGRTNLAAALTRN